MVIFSTHSGVSEETKRQFLRVSRQGTLMTTNQPTLKDCGAFYDAAILGLRALDAREVSPRRFGADADARWSQFAGALGHGDRLDILLRDAAGTWGAAFSPSECFGISGLADDEPFGPDWVGIQDHVAKKMVTDSSRPTTIDEIAEALGVKSAPVVVPPLTPATKLAVAGGAALVAVAKAFAADHTLSWTDQVAVVSSNGAFRQLGGLAAVLVGARGRTIIVRPGTDAASDLRSAGFGHIDAAMVSPDAEPEAAEFVRSQGAK